MRNIITTSGLVVAMVSVALMARADADYGSETIKLAQTAAGDEAQQGQTQDDEDNPQNAGDTVRQVDDLLGKEVGTVETRTIGEIKYMLAEDDQMFAVVVVNASGSGNREVVVPFDRLKVGPTNAVTTDLTLAEIEALPEYNEEMSDAQILPESHPIDKEPPE